MKYILDSNAFDYILDNKIGKEEVEKKGEFFTSNVQRSELMNIPDEARRISLLEIYAGINQVKLNSESGIWIDDLRWDDDEVWHDESSPEFIELQNGNAKDSKDALIRCGAFK